MKHVAQPYGSRCCGQACLAMVFGKTLDQICAVIGDKGTHYTTLRKAAAFFGKELGPIIDGRNNPLPVVGLYVARIIFTRKPHASHFVVLKGMTVHDPEYGAGYLRTDWLKEQRYYRNNPKLTFTSWVRVASQSKDKKEERSEHQSL